MKQSIDKDIWDNRWKEMCFLCCEKKHGQKFKATCDHDEKLNNRFMCWSCIRKTVCRGYDENDEE